MRIYTQTLPTELRWAADDCRDRIDGAEESRWQDSWLSQLAEILDDAAREIELGRQNASS